MKLEGLTLDDLKNITGPDNKNIKIVESLYNVKLNLDSESITTSTEDPKFNEDILKMFELLLMVSKSQIKITERDIVYIKNLIDDGNTSKAYKLYADRKLIDRTVTGKPIYPKTIKQIEYVDALINKDLVFGVGPAGTGKTYLAVVYAASLLKKGLIKHLILTRPAVEAGESLGFLPGDLKEKIDPYLRPLYDALYDTLGVSQTEGYIERGVIEIAPLAYMRGRTLEDCYAILDEAQNTTTMQMKMFLTRLGFNSKMVITGDISQIDLPNNKKSGLVEATKILSNIDEISIIRFEKEDVVRHPLVAKILREYEKMENNS